jgi:hypothetical protein
MISIKELSLLMPSVVGMIQLLNSLPSKSLNLEISVLETKHPSVGLNEKMIVHEVPLPALGAVFKVDHKSKTLKTETFNNSVNIGMASMETQQVTYSFGRSYTWQTTARPNQFGLKTLILPFFNQNWLIELQRNLIWIATRCTTWTMTHPIPTKMELDLAPILGSPVLSKGFSWQSPLEFLDQLIAEKGPGGEFGVLMNQTIPMDIKSNSYVLLAERQAIATVLHHLGIGGILVVDDTCIAVWKNCRNIRNLMAQVKQTTNLEYQDIANKISTKAKFLRSFTGCKGNVATVCESVLTFVTTDLDIEQVRGCIVSKQERTNNLIKSYATLCELMLQTHDFESKTILLKMYNETIKGNIMGHNIHRWICKDISHFMLNENIKKFYSILIGELTVESNVYESGFIRQLVDSMLIEFTIHDIEWIFELDVLKKLLP